MEETEEGLKEMVISRLSSCQWAVLDKHNLKEGHSGREGHELEPGEGEK